MEQFSKIETFCLQNGIRVVMEQMPFVRTAAFGIFASVGSADETVQNNGVSHLIEHMMFKGTTTKNAKQLADLTARIGDSINASTGKETTSYYGLTTGENLPKLVNLLADMLHNSVFEKKCLSLEKKVVIEEIEMYNNSPEDFVGENLEKKIWNGHPLSFQISGNKSVVRTMKREDVLQYFSEHYSPKNLVLSVAGAFEPKALRELLEKEFGGGKKEKARMIREDGPGKEIAVYRRSFCTAKRDTSQLNMNLSFPAISYLDPRKKIATVFYSIFGASNNSLLFQKIREERGLTYSIYAYSAPHAKEGSLHIDVVNAPGQTEEIFLRVLDICEEIREKPVSEEVLSIHKEMLRTNMIMAGERVQGHMDVNGRRLLMGEEPRDFEKELALLEAVTASDVQQFARDILRPQELSISLVGEMGGADKKLRSHFEKLSHPSGNE